MLTLERLIWGVFIPIILGIFSSDLDNARNRYCTSDQKTGPASKFIRQTWPENATIICAIGLRAEESPARARKPICREREDASAPTRNRLVYDWLPMFHFTQAEIWEAIGYTLADLEAVRACIAGAKAVGRDPFEVIQDLQFRAHPAYALGTTRLSCRLCVLASRGDLMIGAEYNPDHYRDLVDLEIASGFSFRQSLWLAALHPELLTEKQRRAFADLRNRKAISARTSGEHARPEGRPIQLSLFE